MRNILLTAVAALSLATLGMAAAETQQTEPRHHTDMPMMQNCPMKVPGTDVSVTDAANGIVLTITTKSGEVAELRRRIEGMVKMHSAPSNADKHGDMMPMSITYEEIAGGARLTFIPKDPAYLDAFRATVREHVEQMKKGECRMMQGMMQGMMNGMKDPEPPKPEGNPTPEEKEHSAHHPPGEKK